jgi:hypothetical protein
VFTSAQGGNESKNPVSVRIEFPFDTGEYAACNYSITRQDDGKVVATGEGMDLSATFAALQKPESSGIYTLKFDYESIYGQSISLSRDFIVD